MIYTTLDTLLGSDTTRKYQLWRNRENIVFILLILRSRIRLIIFLPLLWSFRLT